ncbi:MAG: glycosyltransferase [Gammaproteobacteria bacterium]
MFDAVFITNLPAFYKTNLYQAIAERKKIFVIFIGRGSQIRTDDFSGQTIEFPHCFLNDRSYEARVGIKSMLRLIQVLNGLEFKKIILGGWDLPEYWMTWLFQPKRKLLLALESGIGESKTTGLVAWIKKAFLSRIDGVLASGDPHQALLKTLGYQGMVWLTGGVGLMNQMPILPRSIGFQNRYLYLGRLSAEKNLDCLINAFNTQREASLTLVGNGPELDRLRAIAGPMIIFQSHVPNHELNVVFQQHDALILPSLREPWGLVVEEALYHGLPVLLSDKVGCREWVTTYRCGYLFDPYSANDLLKKMRDLKCNYAELKQNAEDLDFKIFREHQITQYEELLSASEPNA